MHFFSELIRTVDDAYSDFLTVLHFALDNVLGFKLVTIRESDPPYITPDVKILLRKRNRLLRSRRLTEAEFITRKISARIAQTKAICCQKPIVVIPKSCGKWLVAHLGLILVAGFTPFLRL